MKTFLRELPYWTLPPAFYRFGGIIKRKFSQQLTGAEQAELSHNAKLADCHAGERGFLLGCGPSINTQDLSPLGNEICMGVSNFFVHKDYDTIAPAYHCVSGWHDPITREAWGYWLSEVEEKTGDSTIFIPLPDRQQIVDEGRFDNRKMHYVHARASELDLRRRGVDLTCRTLAHGGVLVMALQVLLYMGFKQIYLLGFDQDQVLNYKTTRHFYGDEESALSRTGYSEWFYEDFGRICMAYVVIWDQLRLIRHVAQKRGIEIVNATAGGLLDLFPRAVYEELV